jgi:pseudaminic acid cytidylyltransferase
VSGSNNVAVIPARGGSKRISRKNIREFAGQPIIAWSIQAAMSAGCFDRIIVSTDDEEIVAVAREYGATVPFMRPAELADDHATTLAVMQHAVTALGIESEDLSLVCCLYPAAPFIEAQDLLAARDVLTEADWDYVIPVTRFAYPIERAVRLSADSSIEMVYPEHRNARSQDLNENFHDAGQFYWGKSTAFAAQRPLFSERSASIILPRYRVHDIDTPEDWETAERSWRAQRTGAE